MKNCPSRPEEKKKKKRQRNTFYSQMVGGHGAQELRPTFMYRKRGLGTAAETHGPDNATEKPSR